MLLYVLQNLINLYYSFRFFTPYPLSLRPQRRCHQGDLNFHRVLRRVGVVDLRQVYEHLMVATGESFRFSTRRAESCDKATEMVDSFSTQNKSFKSINFYFFDPNC